MLDIKKIRANAEEIQKKLRTKDPTVDLTPILALDESIRSLKGTIESKQAELKATSKLIGEKKRKGEDASEPLEAVSGLGTKIDLDLKKLKQEEALFEDAMARLPNIPDDDIKVSLDPKDNVCIKTFGEKIQSPFPLKNHLELNEKLGLLDFKRGAKLTGSGWPVYSGMGARLEWALQNLMIDIHIKNGFEFYLIPHVVKPETMYGAGQLPKFRDQLFKLDDDDYPFMLIPTGEVALNGLHLDEIIPSEELTKKYTTISPCFRREAGAAGSGERGLIRVHQFNKVEMYCFAHPDKSDEVFEEMLKSAEEVLETLGLHYRNMLLVTGDMSFPSSRTVDIEVYLPGQERYYEVSSVSNCRDFQARRSKIRMREKGGKPELLHTLNGSGLATARLFVALLENNQNEDGSVNIPKALQPYLGGCECLKP